MSSRGTLEVVAVLWFSAATAAGSFLFFCIQPLVGKFLLPWFGGSSGIWTACMLFFQLILVAGYLYVFLLRSFLHVRHQLITHCVLMMLCVIQLPITMEQLPLQTSPVVNIIYLLIVSAGLPCLLLSSTAPLLQSWFADLTDRSPYPLFALSNFGSMLALLSYPILIEPLLARQSQLILWSWGFGLFLVSMMICVLFRRQATSTKTAVVKPSHDFKIMWLVWPAIAVVMLLALTERLTSNSLVLPFLWILPFACYLLSFILCFANERLYSRGACGILLQVSIPIWLWFYVTEPANFAAFLSVNLVTLFASCMVCHGELAKLKPQPGALSLYYLCLAAGGALGGISVSLLAPLVFSMNFDLLFAVTILLMLCSFTYRVSKLNASLFLALSAATLLTLQTLWRGQHQIVERSRNFYGTLEVVRKYVGTDDESLTLIDRGTPHGAQYQSAHRKSEPTGYYTRKTAAGILLQSTQDRGARNIGLVGMGVGTLLTYTTSRDDVRIYEINPDVIRIGQEKFSFLADAKAQVTLIEGDARQRLAQESPQQFDILILDAFTGDSIPLHLLTAEAFELYLRHLHPTGQILVLSDTVHVDFAHALQKIAKHFSLSSRGFWLEQGDAETWGAEWFLFARKSKYLTIKRALDSELNFIPDESYPLLTDEYSSLWQMVRWSDEEE